MFVNKVLFLVTLLTGYCGCFEEACPESTLHTVLEERAYSVLHRPDLVILYKDQYTVLFLNKAQIEDLKKVILNDQNYDFDLIKDAVFTQDTVLVFKKGTEEVRLIISHHAQQILFKNSDHCVVLDCDPGFDALMALIKNFVMEAL